MFDFLRRQGMAWPLAIETKGASPLMRTQAAWNIEKDTLILFSLNLSGQSCVTTWDIAPLARSFADVAKVESLSSPTARVSVGETLANPIVYETADLRIDGRSVALTAKPYSATAIRLRVTRQSGE